MHLVYIDDSGDERFSIFSALILPASTWSENFATLKEFRRSLRDADGIYVQKELHAWKFVSGRGDISDRHVSKERRCDIFRDVLRLATRLRGAKLINACFPEAREEHAFERLLTRINRNMQARNSHAVIICDSGKELDYTRLARRLRVFNPIPSQFGSWGKDGPTKNMPTDRIIEDLFFKKSEHSYFIQMADFCAYALLRHKSPLESKSRYGLNTAFQILSPILVLEANKKDPQGIICP